VASISGSQRTTRVDDFEHGYVVHMRRPMISSFQFGGGFVVQAMMSR
jgi:hypothetical protein